MGFWLVREEIHLLVRSRHVPKAGQGSRPFVTARAHSGGFHRQNAGQWGDLGFGRHVCLGFDQVCGCKSGLHDPLGGFGWCGLHRRGYRGRLSGSRDCDQRGPQDSGQRCPRECHREHPERDHLSGRRQRYWRKQYLHGVWRQRDTDESDYHGFGQRYRAGEGCRNRCAVHAERWRRREYRHGHRQCRRDHRW